MQAYSDESRTLDPYSLPDLEIFELTAREMAERDEDLIWEYKKRSEFKLAGMNGRDTEKMFDAMIDEQGITGGWFYWYCFPGCLPDSDPIGPFETAQQAKAAAQEDAGAY